MTSDTQWEFHHADSFPLAVFVEKGLCAKSQSDHAPEHAEESVDEGRRWSYALRVAAAVRSERAMEGEQDYPLII